MNKKMEADHHRRESYRLRCMDLRDKLEDQGCILIPAIEDMTKEFVSRWEEKFDSLERKK